MRIIPIIFFGTLLFFSVIALHGETLLSSLEEIAAYGAQHNLDYKNSQVNVLQAEDNRVSFLKLKNSSISVDASILENIGDSSNLPENKTGLGFSSTLSVPLIEQVSLSATVSDDLSGKFGFSLSPLAHSSTSIESEINYKSAMITAESSMTEAEINAVESALNWMTATRELSASSKESEFAEIQYNDDKIRYGIGEVTLDDLQESLIQWSEARVLLSIKEQDLKTAKSLLYRGLGAGTDQISIRLLDLETLSDSLRSLKDSFDPLSVDPLKNADYLISILNVQSREAVLKNTWIYEPDIQADAGLSFDSSGLLSVEAGFQFKISPDNFQKDQRKIAEDILNISISEAEQSRNQAELEFEQLIESISSTSLNSEISLLELEQAEILFSEAQILFERGDYSEVELEESQLTMEKADNALFKALSEEYLAWLELKKNI